MDDKYFLQWMEMFAVGVWKFVLKEEFVDGIWTRRVVFM